MANNSSLSKRAALRQQQELEERNKRNRRILGAGIGLAVVTVIVVLAIVIVQALTSRVEVTAEQQTPPNATANHGILYNGVEPSDDVPHLVVWEDFQCPWCKVYEDTYGSTFHQLAADGKITIEVRTATLLDGTSGDDSHRAALAGAAADAVGQVAEYHEVVDANQTDEGGGFSDEQTQVDAEEAAGLQGELRHDAKET